MFWNLGGFGRTWRNSVPFLLYDKEDEEKEELAVNPVCGILGNFREFGESFGNLGGFGGIWQNLVPFPCTMMKMRKKRN